MAGTATINSPGSSTCSGSTGSRFPLHLTRYEVASSMAGDWASSTLSDMGRFLSVGMWVIRAASKSDGAAEFGFAAQGTATGLGADAGPGKVASHPPGGVDQWRRRRNRFPVAVGDGAFESGGGEPYDTDMCDRGVGHDASGRGVRRVRWPRRAVRGPRKPNTEPSEHGLLLWPGPGSCRG